MLDFRARSNSELLDAAFELYRRNFFVLVTIAALALLPVTCALFFRPEPGRIIPSPTYLILSFVGGIVTLWMNAVLIAAVSKAYMGGPVDIGTAFQTGLAHPGSVLYAAMTKGAFVGLGFILFIVPGVFMAIRYFAVPATVVLEHRATKSALKRSRDLAQDSKGRIFTLLGSVWLAYLVLAIVTSEIMTGVLHSLPGEAIGRLIIGSVFYPLIAAVTTLLYYDIRIRKEGYDIELMSGGLSQLRPATA